MSDILIKNIEMPKSCGECKLAVNAYGSQTEGKCAVLGYGVTYLRKRHRACPLVEVPTHGRLIDADALQAELEEHSYPSERCWYYAEAGQFIDEAETILEASNGTDN